MIVHASAPVRLDFAGGWTDVAPFATEERGVVVNAAIDLRAVVRLETGTPDYRLESADLGVVETAASLEALAGDRCPLLAAAVRRYRLPPCHLATRSDAPPGSGLGSSGALGVALVAACEAAAGARPAPAVLAERAFEIEAVDAAHPGGRQDQYAAALGGFNRLEFDGSGVAVTPLQVAPAFATRLAAGTVLAYSGQSRVSGETIARVMGRYRSQDDTVTAALRGMTEIADAMAAALLAADLGRVAQLLAANWACQRRLDAGMQTELMARLEAAAMAAGARGGKAAGAGAGGSMFFVTDHPPAQVAAAVAGAGATILPLRWSSEGVRVW